MASSLETALAPGRSAPSERPGVSLTDALLLLTVLIWGANYAVVKYGTGLVDPLAYNTARIILATVAFLAIVLARPRRTSLRDVLGLLALGVLGNGVYQALFVEGVAHTRAGTAALILSASPAFTAVIGRMLGVERIGGRGIAGIALSLIGIAVIFGHAGPAAAAGSPTLLGNAFCLAAALCWAVFIVLLKPYTDRVSLIDVSAYTLVGGAVPIVVFSWHAMAATPWAELTPLTWSAIVYSGLGSLVLGYLFWYRGIRLLGPTRTSIYSNLQPIIALAVSWMLLGETPTAWQGLGAGTIIAGVILTRT
jgi:drug/metabolite transporter (DMT)-like permease